MDFNQYEQDKEDLIATIADGREKVEMAKAFERLKKNPDFIKVIDKGFLQDEAVRLVSLLGDPTLPDPQEVEKNLRSIGALHQYFRFLRQNGRTMERSIDEAEANLIEIEQQLDNRTS